MRLLLAILLLSYWVLLSAGPSFAEDKSFYSPVIFVDKENHRVLISTLGSVFYIEAPGAAEPHLDKLPISGLVDFVVEMRDGKMPLIKSWKVKSGESTCMFFNGKECK
ncbi:MAG TPA: hypothetical protein VFS39_01975 [Nitrospira sp.]|nr:hypothetical protein [Nitrospira sp.]